MSANTLYLSASATLASLPLLLPNVSPTPEQVRELSSSLVANLSALQSSKELATSSAVGTQGRANAVAEGLESAVSSSFAASVSFAKLRSI
jgi:hypothetical protein